MIVLGSGGHTAEMLKLMDAVDKHLYCPRTYVVAETDKMSGLKALARERSWAESPGEAPSALGPPSSQDYEVCVIPRSREVFQSYFTSVLTTLYSLGVAARLVWREKPQLVLVNGPGTCIPVCAAAFLYRFLGLRDSQLVYVESIARVFKMSLSAKILYYTRMADLILVQWEELEQKYPRTVFSGRLY